MTQKINNAKVYKSPSTGIDCDAAQYIAELMCQRQAYKDKIPCLEFKFWNKSQKVTYKAQIVAARRLVKEFGEHAVLSYIMANRSIYSLGRYNTPKFIKEGIKKCKLKPVPRSIIKSEAKELKPRKARKKTNLLSKIKKVENG